MERSTVRRCAILVVVALAAGYGALAHRTQAHEDRCFLHCQGELSVAVERTGWPLVYATTRELEGPHHHTFELFPLAVDLLAVWGAVIVAALAAAAWSAGGQSSCLRMRARATGTRDSGVSVASTSPSRKISPPRRQ